MSEPECPANQLWASYVHVRELAFLANPVSLWSPVGGRWRSWGLCTAVFSSQKSHCSWASIIYGGGGDTTLFLFQFSFALKWMAFFLHTINNACAGGAFNRTSIHHSKVAFSPKAWEQSVGKMEKPCRWDCPAAFLPGGAHWQQWKMTKKIIAVLILLTSVCPFEKLMSHSTKSQGIMNVPSRLIGLYFLTKSPTGKAKHFPNSSNDTFVMIHYKIRIRDYMHILKRTT